MPIIFETNQFIVKGHDNPHHHRDNGGHAVVTPKTKYGDRTKMPTDLYLDMMELVRLVGEAITKVMTKNGINIARINYQDNGNWSYFPQTKKDPHLHIHLYVRSYDEKHPTDDPRFKAFPNALVFPYIVDHPQYYQDFKPYNQKDCENIETEIKRLLKTPKYQKLSTKL